MNRVRIVAVAFVLMCRPGMADCVDVSQLTSFGTMGKEERPLAGGCEADLFSHEGKGCLTHMWFGGDWPGYDRTRIRIYVDGEEKAAIDMEMFLGHGIGFGDAAAPWGNRHFGKTGHPSGIYNNYRIPFGERVRVTAQLPADVHEDPHFWWIIRGVENLPVELGGIRLPDAARLKLYTVENLDLAPLEYIDLAKTKNAGMLFQTTMSIRSPHLSFLEALVRAYIDGNEAPLLMASGTEDYFVGTYYFNRGAYHLPEAGVTHLEKVGDEHQFSGYRFHEADPLVFHKGLRLVWRNGETKPDGSPFHDPHPCNLFSYVWMYEWPAK